MTSLNTYHRPMLAAFTAIIVACFFLPWVKIHHSPVKSVKKLVRAQESAPVLVTSGYGIPALANGFSQKMFIKVANLFFDDIENIDKKSYLVWCVPALAVLVTGIGFACWERRNIIALLGAVSIGCGAAGIIKILTTKLDSLLLSVEICGAMWAQLMFFLLLGAGLLTKSVLLKRGSHWTDQV